jgi:hypothetical protein
MNSQLPQNDMPLKSTKQNFSDANPQHPKPDLDSMSELEHARLISKTWSMGQQ